MTVERETAGFALPFAAGVLLAIYSDFSISHISTAVPSCSCILLGTAMAMLMHPHRQRVGRGWRQALICLAALTCGALCGITSQHLVPSGAGLLDRLAEWAQRWGLEMQKAIDRIPFEDSRCNAVAKALITGERHDIPRSVIDAFRESGASHILALSGLHLGIVYGIIKSSLSIFGNHHRLWIPRSTAIILICGAYTLATGAGASITRAFLFIVLGEAARLNHRHHSTGQLLLASLIIQLAISPSSAADAGFQLSYAAMGGIAFILPWLKSFWKGNIYDDSGFTRLIRRIWDTCAMSISCQITTGPLAYFYFGTMPRYFLLTNLIALPLTGLLVPVILLTLCLDCAGTCPPMLITVCEKLIWALIRSLEIIAGM